MAEISKVRFGGVDYDIRSITDTSLSEAGTPADAMSVGRSFKSIEYAEKVINGAFPNASGVITAGASWNTYCYRVPAGSVINSIELGASSQQLIYAFYTDEPSIGSVSYNNNRVSAGSGVLTGYNISVPAGSNVNWVAIRVSATDSPKVVVASVQDVNKSIRNFTTDYSFTDLNNADINKIYYVSPSRITANYPDGLGAAYVQTIALNNSNKAQIIIGASDATVRVRICVAGTWGIWNKLEHSATVDTLASASIVNRYNSYSFTDLNDISDNSIYYVSPNKVTGNYPDGLGAAYVQTIKYNQTNYVQLIYGAYGTSAYMRGCVNGTWGDWKALKTREESSGEFVEKSDYYEASTIALFPTVGCCGDSFTAGYLYNKPDSTHYDPDYVPNGEYSAIGYPAVMGRLYGVDVTAYAKGGLTSTAWRTDTRGLPALLADEPKNLYIIALGLNDRTQSVPIGVESDIDTEPSTPTYLGNMGAIIRAIQNHAQLAKIILCKSLWMDNAYYNYISQGVELLSSHLGIPYLETKGDPYFESNGYKNGLKGLHPTAPLYAGIGRRIGEKVGKCVFDNPEYFYNFYVPNS